MNKPSFVDFYKGSFSSRSTYSNFLTKKLYIEKNGHSNRMRGELLLCFCPVVAFLICWIIFGINNISKLYLIIESILSLLYIFVVYPARYYFVNFVEVKNFEDEIEVYLVEKALFLGYFIIKFLIYFIVKICY